MRFEAGEFIVESVMGIGYDNATLEYFLEKVMTFAIGVEFVKMLCTHTLFLRTCHNISDRMKHAFS